MSLKIPCDFCHQDQNEPGGLLFTPVVGKSGVKKKQHICVLCCQRVRIIVDLGAPRGTHATYYGPPMDQVNWEVPVYHLDQETTTRVLETLQNT